MGNTVMVAEFPDESQRYQICKSQFLRNRHSGLLNDVSLRTAAHAPGFVEHCIQFIAPKHNVQDPEEFAVWLQNELVGSQISKVNNKGGRSLSVLLNRDEAGVFKIPEDGWYHVAPLGEFLHPDSGIVQVIDNESVVAMVNRFAKDAKEENFPGLLVDFDHFSQDVEKPSEAAGWIESLENRNDGLWAKIRWSDIGEAAVKGGRYRLVSPVWKQDDCEKLTNGRMRPKRLDTVALTNDPNLKGLTPLSNRNNIKNKETIMDWRAKLMELLGLPPESTDEQIMAACQGHLQSMGNMKYKLPEVMNRAATANRLETEKTELTTKNTELTNRVTKLEGDNTTLLNAQVERDLTEFEPVIDDKEETKKLLLSNRDGTLLILKGSLKKHVEANGKPKPGAQPRIHNRAAAGQPNPGKQGGAGDDETDTINIDAHGAAWIRNRASEIRKTDPKLTFTSAFNRARSEYVKQKEQEKAGAAK